MTMTTLIIGNGESRSLLNLKTISLHKIGCNAIYRDYDINQLVCIDRKMVREAYSNGCNNIYTRKEWIHEFDPERVKSLPDIPFNYTHRYDDPIHWNSGIYAILLGALQFKELHLIGFDLYSSDPYINNIYKDTINYQKSNSVAINPIYWIIQISKLMDNFPSVNFVIHQPGHWTMPTQWYKDNVRLTNLDFSCYNTI